MKFLAEISLEIEAESLADAEATAHAVASDAVVTFDEHSSWHKGIVDGAGVESVRPDEGIPVLGDTLDCRLEGR